MDYGNRYLQWRYSCDVYCWNITAHGNDISNVTTSFIMRGYCIDITISSAHNGSETSNKWRVFPYLIHLSCMIRIRLLEYGAAIDTCHLRYRRLGTLDCLWCTGTIRNTPTHLCHSMCSSYDLKQEGSDGFAFSFAYVSTSQHSLTRMVVFLWP